MNRLINTLLKRMIRSAPEEEFPILHDPIEDDPQYKDIIAAAEAEAEREVVEVFGIPKSMGFCHAFWPTKKRILKEKYGIDWKSPAELNPNVLFD